jgi:hypothetical protein
MDSRMDTGSRSPVGSRGKSWLDEALRPFNFMTAIRERQSVRRTSRRCLELYRQFEVEKPASSPRERYEQVVARYLGASDAKTVRVTLRRAEESFASWPVERDLNFRDVVQYLAATEYYRDNPTESGIRARVSSVVAEAVPEGL